MAEYVVMCCTLIPVRASGVSYVVNVFPTGHNGAVPVKQYLLEDELKIDLSRLGISTETYTKILESFARQRCYAVYGVKLTDEIAKEFGFESSG